MASTQPITRIFPPEVIDNIVGFTAKVVYGACAVVARPSYRPSYSTTLSLTQTSHYFYIMAMRHLLRTVVCDTREQRLQFVSTLARLSHKSPRLGAIGREKYVQYVRRYHDNGGWHVADWDIQYPEVYWQIIRQCQCLSLNCSSIELLGQALSLGIEGRINVRQYIVGGARVRWNPLTGTEGGRLFLRNLTHLALSIPHLNEGETIDEASQIRTVPFEAMPNLAYFAYILSDEVPSNCAMIVYKSPLGGREVARNPFEGGWEVSVHPIPCAGGLLAESDGYLLSHIDGVWRDVEEQT